MQKLVERAKRRALSLGVACVLAAGGAAAEASHVVNRCPRLSAASYDELDARVLLLLSNEARRAPPAVFCANDEAWVEWNEQRYPITGKGPIADEVVEIIETQLHAEQQPPADVMEPASPADSTRAPPAAAAAPPPAVSAAARPADRVAVRPENARGGGISLGIQTELPSASVATSMGPAFDFAASVGPLLLGGREAIRFSVAGPRVSFMDFQASVAYGAPFDPAAHLGVVARFGAEWLVAYPEGNSGQAKVVPITDVGLRLANSFGMLGLWFGIDGHFRMSELALRSRGRLGANDIGGSFTLGAMFVDWSRK